MAEEQDVEEQEGGEPKPKSGLVRIVVIALFVVGRGVRIGFRFGRVRRRLADGKLAVRERLKRRLIEDNIACHLPGQPRTRLSEFLPPDDIQRHTVQRTCACDAHFFVRGC